MAIPTKNSTFTLRITLLSDPVPINPCPENVAFNIMPAMLSTPVSANGPFLL
jgi:hypothetical protein